MLILPDIRKDFEVYCGASKQGLGCVLMEKGNWDHMKSIILLMI